MMNISDYKHRPVIRTPDQRLRVFVSSTLKELAQERAVAREAISRLHLAPVMFELGARPHLARNLYRAYLEQSHIFIGIYSEQYGLVAPGAMISGLEEEYHLAKDKPKLIYIKKPAPSREPRLQEMLTSIRDRDGISYKYFSSGEELRDLIESDLALLLTERFEMSQLIGQGSVPDEHYHNLPASPTSLIGREQEVQAACELLLNDGVRLVTFTGPGGSGKTRLSIEVASRLIAHFEQIYFVELTTISDPTLIADAIANTLGIREVGARHAEESLKDFLRDRHAFLVLDNFEQIVPAATLVATLLEYCPRIKVLVTSRMALQVRGEKEFPVRPLAVPDSKMAISVEGLLQYSAVTLFCQRALAIKSDFVITKENAPTVIEICRCLDGLPLAIELAAARIRSLSPQAMLRRLEHRLPLLTGGARDLPKRQQTMRNTIAWSYELLETHEATLFRRLSVFSGGCILESADAICNRENDLSVDIFEVLEALVNKNLIRSSEDPNRDIRFGMLETIREYALERLTESGEKASMFARHAEYFVDLAETAEPYLTSGKRDPWLARLEVELDNLRAVFSRSLEQEIDPMFGIRQAGTLGWFWHLRGHLTEGRNWASSLMKLPEAADRTRARAKVLFPAGGLAWSQGDYTMGNAILEESASIFQEIGDTQGLLNSQAILAGGVASLGDYDKAFALCEDTIALMRETGDRWGVAFTPTWFGAILLVKTGDAAAARAMFEESLAISEELDDPWIRAEALNHLGVVAGWQGDYEAARQYFEKSLAYHESIGDHWAIARGLSGYGDVMLRQNNYNQAKVLFQKSIIIWREMGNCLGILTCLPGLAQIAATAGEVLRAARLYGTAPEPVRTVGYLFLHIDPREYVKSLASARTELGEAAWAVEYENGRKMTLEEAVDYALEKS